MARRGRKADKTGRSNGDSRHVRLHHWLLQTAAYRSLSPAARSLLVELYALYNGENNGDLFLSVREAAARINVSPPTASRSFTEMKERGFIRENKPGSFHLKIRHATSWVLTEYGHGGQLATKDFTRWEAPKIQNPVQLVKPNGATGETVALLRRVK